ncbi:unnamed protein product [Adineta ricciae]|uniref:Cns1/TTC4 wheel domain-containing protein n=1 Tax=Adineta ricciae TaxID=249248 RepID=A0A814AC99_ADIRI|nr:unnamed protein product [Adineta ricciae]
MAQPTPEELDRQLDEFIDNLVDNKDNLPSAELDDAFWKDLEGHPFFMKEMPEEGAELHPAAAALQALKWDDDDDTPLDKAIKFKDEGNKYYELKKYRNAILAYTEGIKQRCSDPTTNAVLFCNRATANFYLGNYRSALRDCVLSRKSNIKKLKLGAQPVYHNEKLIEMRDRAARLQKETERDERKKQGLERKQRNEQQKILNVVKKQNIRIQQDPSIDIFDISSNPAGSCIQLNEQDQTLTFPVVFLYPEYGQTDYIKEFHQDTKLIDQLTEMFQSRAPWDEEGKYTLDQMSIYYEDRDKHELKTIPSDKTLLQTLQLPGFVIQLGMPSLIVMIPNSVFAKHYLKMFATLKLALTLAIIRLTPSHLTPKDFTIQLQNNLRRKRNNDAIQFEQVLVDVCSLRKSTRAIRIPTHVLDLLDHHGRFLQNVFTHSVDLNIELQTLIMETIDRIFELMKQNLLRIQDETYEIMFRQLITMIASYSVIPNIQKHFKNYNQRSATHRTNRYLSMNMDHSCQSSYFLLVFEQILIELFALFHHANLDAIYASILISIQQKLITTNDSTTLEQILNNESVRQQFHALLYACLAMNNNESSLVVSLWNIYGRIL